MAGKGFTDKGNRITPTSPFDWDTGEKLSAGEGAGTSDTTEATQLDVLAAVNALGVQMADVLTAVESLVASSATEATLELVRGSVDGLEALQTSTNTKLDDLKANTDGLEASATATNTKLDTLISDATPAPIESGIFHVNATPVLDTSAYASGDTLFNSTVITSATKLNDKGSLLQSLALIDKSDQGVAITLHFFSANVTFGTANAAPSLSDSDAVNFLGTVEITTTDYKDVGGAKIATIKGIGLDLSPASGTKNVYVAAAVTGTPTFALGDLVFRFGFIG